MTTKERAEVEQMLDEYEVTVTKILPRSYDNGDDAIVDEISHLLSVRDWLEQRKWEVILAGLEQQKNLHERLARLDTELLKHRHIILNAYERYQEERKRLNKSPAAWWWWLDFPEALRTPARRN